MKLPYYQLYAGFVVTYLSIELFRVTSCDENKLFEYVENRLKNMRTFHS